MTLCSPESAWIYDPVSEMMYIKLKPASFEDELTISALSSVHIDI